METKLRKSGVEILGDISWGTHFCQFFETRNDLTGLLVPYFKAGLESHEYCMWVVSDPLSVEDALVAMRESVPAIDDYIQKGQMEIIPHTEWYMKDGHFDLQRALNGLVKRLETALAKGYEGLRFTGNTTWLERKDWRDFEEYESALNGVIGQYRMIANCTYSLERCTATDVLDLVRNYQFALMRAKGSWEVIRIGLKADPALYTLAAIVESSEDAIISKTLDGVILSWNRGAERIYGYTAEEIIGRPVFDLVPPERVGEVRDILGRIRGGDRVFSYETTRIRKDGSPIQVSVTISPIKDAAGRIIGASTIARDITLQKQSEEALRLAVAYNRSLIEASLDPLVTIGPNGKITDVNTGTELATGCSRADLIGKDFADYFTDPQRAREGYQQAFREGSVRDYALEIRHRDGHLTPVLYNASVYRDETGAVIGLFAAARDITVQKQTEEALRLAGVYNRSLIEASLDPLVTIGPDGKITDVNTGTELATGSSREELIGRDFADYFADFERAREGYQQAFREGSVRDYALEIRHRDGHLTPVLYNASVYRDENGKIIGLFAAARDITAQKIAMEQLREQQKAFMEVSVPVVDIWRRIILVPLIGIFDSKRAQLLMETLLGAIETSQAKVAILDISGIPIMDTLVAKHLIRTAAAARLMGTDCIITGIKANISQTIVQIGVDLTGILTKTTLDEGIRLAFDMTKMKVVPQ